MTRAPRKFFSGSVKTSSYQGTQSWLFESLCSASRIYRQSWHRCGQFDAKLEAGSVFFSPRQNLKSSRLTHHKKRQTQDTASKLRRLDTGHCIPVLTLWVLACIVFRIRSLAFRTCLGLLRSLIVVIVPRCIVRSNHHHSHSTAHHLKNMKLGSQLWETNVACPHH